MTAAHHGNSARPAPRARFWAYTRLCACLAVFGAAAATWGTYRVHAYGERILSQAGEHMMRYAGASHQTAPEELSINGARFYLSTGNVRATADEVLDTFQSKCAQRNGALREQWAKLGQLRGVELGPYSSLLDGVFRSESVVACTETNGPALPPEALVTRIQRVLATGDLAQLGGLRYAYVKPSRTHDGKAVFVALWSEGQLNIREMFPKAGDAPGADPEGVPRPRATRRVLSTQPTGQPVSFNMYASQSENSAQLLAFYRAQLPRAGFKIISSKPGFTVAESRDAMLTLSLRDDPKTGKGVVTLAAHAQ